MTLSLFSPIKLGPYQLPNRIVMAPLTGSRAGDGNVPHLLNALYYAQRASAGLIIAEATQVVPEGQGYISTPGIHSDEQTEGWKQITTAVHAVGGRIFLQLWHVGRISHRSFQPNGAPPVAPSPIRPKGQAFTANGFEDHPTLRALEASELPVVVEGYRQGASGHWPLASTASKCTVRTDICSINSCATAPIRGLTITAAASPIASACC